ncbi:MATE family efflux transporter [Clostridium sp. D33t1_170424_F3]|uniref:MATE family efflux transporter n=1 Tax=Clostridium sp. D33t1_170424_F3 TaxID=2787099 RepID=UPI0018A91B0C|nr:MATE family efflux transporter [Clostridium sp. D33t1_170424_F3]MDC0700599.1 MATE family efflux transporter [Blautia wexlerae]
MRGDLTKGSEAGAILRFSLPMMGGALLQQLYNVVDTLIVSHFIGADALAAVGSSYTLMVFLTSVVLGLCMGSGVIFSIFFGARQTEELRRSLFNAFLFIALVSAVIFILAACGLEWIMALLKIPDVLWADTRAYLQIILWGIGFTFLYNFFAAALRSIGNSALPLIALAAAALLNVLLDILFVLPLGMGVAGAAYATVAAQALSAAVVLIYSILRVPAFRLTRDSLRFDRRLMARIVQCSVLSSIQQSIMNFGILLIQGLVNSFGVAAMAAFAAGVKVDSFAYLPVQEFGNAFSTYAAQNRGAHKGDRIASGLRASVLGVAAFCLGISLLVAVFARPLMTVFVSPSETEILAIGIQYLRIEGSCYVGIGLLFLLYGLYRGLEQAQMSILLTVLSLGARVAFAYALAPIPQIGLTGIWWTIPIGWLLADVTGFLHYRFRRERLLASPHESVCQKKSLPQSDRGG